MPIAQSAVYRVRVYGVYSAARVSETLNVFYYAPRTPPLINPLAGSQQVANDLLEHIQDVVLNNVQVLVHRAQRFTRVTIDCVPPTNNIPDILVDVPVDFPGAITVGDAMPPFTCWTFRYIRSAAKMRNGYKRFAGLAEVNSAGGVITFLPPGTPVANGATLERVNQTIAALQEPLYGNTIPTTDDVFPVIYSDRWHAQGVPDPFIQFVQFVQLKQEVGSQRTRR